MRAWTCALALLGIGASHLCAQDPECAAAVGRLDAGLRTGSQFAADVQLMPGCPNGAATLANVWASAPTSTADLQVLVNGTLDFHDQRLLSALQAAAQSGQGSAARVAALGSMLSYVDSALYVYLPALLAPATRRAPYRGYRAPRSSMAKSPRLRTHEPLYSRCLSRWRARVACRRSGLLFRGCSEVHTTSSA